LPRNSNDLGLKYHSENLVEELIDSRQLRFHRPPRSACDAAGIRIEPTISGSKAHDHGMMDNDPTPYLRPDAAGFNPMKKARTGAKDSDEERSTKGNP
jgi:hypothetical protein